MTYFDIRVDQRLSKKDIIILALMVYQDSFEKMNKARS